MSSDDTTVLYRRAGRGLPKRELRSFAERLVHEVADGREFCCLLTDDKEMRRLNLQFLKKNYATDVLSFPAGEDHRIGDMAISVERAREQAQRYGHELQEEVEILMLHGVLHLLGMDHDHDRGRMARAEKSWRKKLGLGTGLIERLRA